MNYKLFLYREFCYERVWSQILQEFREREYFK
jgi:hypothetical protein